MDPVLYFESMEFVEPRCVNPKCRHVMRYGTDSYYDEGLQMHVCKHCKSPV